MTDQHTALFILIDHKRLEIDDAVAQDDQRAVAILFEELHKLFRELDALPPLRRPTKLDDNS